MASSDNLNGEQWSMERPDPNRPPPFFQMTDPVRITCSHVHNIITLDYLPYVCCYRYRYRNR
jgi:hypothetical protein